MASLLDCGAIPSTSAALVAAVTLRWHVRVGRDKYTQAPLHFGEFVGCEGQHGPHPRPALLQRDASRHRRLKQFGHALACGINNTASIQGVWHRCCWMWRRSALRWPAPTAAPQPRMHTARCRSAAVGAGMDERASLVGAGKHRHVLNTLLRRQLQQSISVFGRVSAHAWPRSSASHVGRARKDAGDVASNTSSTTCASR